MLLPLLWMLLLWRLLQPPSSSSLPLNCLLHPLPPRPGSLLPPHHLLLPHPLPSCRRHLDHRRFLGRLPLGCSPGGQAALDEGQELRNQDLPQLIKSLTAEGERGGKQRR